MLYAVLALVTAIVTAGSFYKYVSTVPENKLFIIIAIVCGILTVVFGGLFLAGRINKNEDIHITE